MKLKINVFLFLFLPVALFGQKGTLEGRVFNPINNEGIPFANIVIKGTNIGSITDLDGKFVFYGIDPGFLQLVVSSIGFETTVSDEVMVTNAKRAYIEIPVNEQVQQLGEIKVKASPFRKRDESPVSMRSIGIAEIEKNPGGNRDISKIIQSLPGVASSVSFRNDVIVRGGGSGENRFYLDGVEIPNLNHFATQGASGGPVGIINVDFVREVDFYSGAFPANRGNALSSVLEFKQVDGNLEKMKYRATVGASDLAFTMDGPLSEKSGIVVSARRSYLQFIFAAIGLPFLPTYNDFQFKVRSRLDAKNEITVIGLGALDQFKLNTDANETESQRYILAYLPVNEQWNYTTGLVYKHFRNKSYDTWVLSRNHLNNTSFKYRNNIETDSLKTLDYASNEIETKLRYENTFRGKNGSKLISGGGVEYAFYDNSTFSKTFIGANPFIINYKTDLDFFKFSAFAQYSQPILDNRLIVSAGLRTDANSYSAEMGNPLKQMSPRVSFAYSITEKFFFNFNTGRYYQQPAYTTFGFRNASGDLVNKKNGLKYIGSDHIVGGFEYKPNELSRITIEGFYKRYFQYPFSVADSGALSSKGADFGVFGDEEVTSTGKGRSFGAELLVQHTNFLGFNLLLAFTLVRSEFDNIRGKLIPTAWDNKQLVSITASRKFKNNWDAGFKWRFVGGAPYTPDDLQKSSLKSAWDARGRTYLDYSRFNTERFGNFHQLDIRVDKQYYFKNWSLMLYLDIQNLYNFKAEESDQYTNLDKDGLPVTDPMDPSRYQLRAIQNDGSGTILPTLGVMLEF